MSLDTDLLKCEFDGMHGTLDVDVCSYGSAFPDGRNCIDAYDSLYSDCLRHQMELCDVLNTGRAERDLIEERHSELVRLYRERRWLLGVYWSIKNVLAT